MCFCIRNTTSTYFLSFLAMIPLYKMIFKKKYLDKIHIEKLHSNYRFQFVAYIWWLWHTFKAPVDKNWYIQRSYCNSVKRSAVTGNPFNGYSVKFFLYKILFPILHCIRLLGENITGQGYWVSKNRISGWNYFRLQIRESSSLDSFQNIYI